MTPEDPFGLLRAMLDAALDVAKPSADSFASLPPPPKGRTIVLGAGKAAASMAAALEASFERVSWPSPVSGLVVTRHGFVAPTTRIEVVEASHPVPDQAGLDATRRILSIARSAGPDDLLIFLVSGGASSLLVAPAEGVSFEEKQAETRRLLAAGAPIDVINARRRELSAVKGGGLARAAAQAGDAATFLISDVPGDAPHVIGSGPTVAPPDDDGAFPYPEHRFIATPQRALEAAAFVAEQAGVAPVILSDRIEGETREVAKVLAAIAAQIVDVGALASPPCVLLSGGETTVTLKSDGAARGGPNTTFSLALALALEKYGVAGDVFALAADTDGIDGSAEAGARIGPDTLSRARALGLDPVDALERDASYEFFDALGDVVITGPTLTNVNDFRAILVAPAATS